MLIECKIKRKGGSRITMLDGTTYHFAPADGDNRNAHVALVTNPDHIQRLLSITEGYRLAAAAPQPDPQAPAPEIIGAKQPATPATVVEPAAPTTSLNREELERLYLEVTGKKPHPAAKDETLLTAIKAAREG